ncbi:MAG: hypothetical protein P8M49_01990 [Thalassotalea sp.]|nr:hypothetical protein [Thalassotalea sp.]MDG2392252.1 hypothetical protein [Thalassotalea sp.]
MKCTTKKEVITETQYIDAAITLDKLRESTVRTEQSFLRNELFQSNPHGTCCICNNIMPTDFLVAHIKKRSKCDEKEKRDYKNIVSPMCKFGCDELYEKGLIAVHKGSVINLNNEPLYGKVDDYLNKLTGQNCKTYNSHSNKYFEWHYLKHKK